MKDDSGADKSEVQTCDLLVRNGYVITMDANGSKHRRGEVAITGRNIVAVGPENEVASRFRPKRVLDAGGAAVHPGYIDLHYHSSNHIVSKMVIDGPAYSEDTGPWAGAAFSRLGQFAREEEMYAAALLAGLDMVRNGYTMYMEPGTAEYPDDIAAACEAVGIRASIAPAYAVDVAAARRLAAPPDGYSVTARTGDLIHHYVTDSNRHLTTVKFKEGIPNFEGTAGSTVDHIGFSVPDARAKI